MKIYISADIEGVCGVSHWDEATRECRDYPEFQKQMTAEVVAACEGALAGGATEIYIKDAHDSARNILAPELPRETSLIRGWSGHPYVMMQGLDPSFHAVLMLGYHAFAGGSGNPLAHTMATRVAEITINGRIASEFLINSYIATLEGVPVVCLTGDAEICRHGQEILPQLHTVAVKSGSGASTTNIHPHRALEKIRASVQQAVTDIDKVQAQTLPNTFRVEVHYTNHQDAYKSSFYPGAELLSPRVVCFSSENYVDVLRFFLFTL